MSSLFLHIGMPKAASSTIQNFLYVEKDTLHEYGLGSCHFLGRRNNRLIYSLVKALAGREDSAFNARGLKTKKEVEKFASGIRNKIEHNFCDLKVKDVVLSCEQLASFDSVEIDILRSLLSKYFSEIKIICYFRRQDLYAVSRYSTQVISGRSVFFHDKFCFPDPSQASLNYVKIIEKWSSVFGSDSVIVRTLDPIYLHKNDVVKDFLYSIGCPLDMSSSPYSVNESLSAAMLEAVRRVNEKLYNSGLSRYDSAKISYATQAAAKLSTRKGERFYPARSEALDFYANFESDNNMIAKAFLDREVLFSDDFDMYPESAVNPSDEDVIDASCDFSATLIKDFVLPSNTK